MTISKVYKSNYFICCVLLTKYIMPVTVNNVSRFVLNLIRVTL